MRERVSECERGKCVRVCPPQMSVFSVLLFQTVSLLFCLLCSTDWLVMGILGIILFLPPVSIGELELQTLLSLSVRVLKLKSSNLQVSTLSTSL